MKTYKTFASAWTVSLLLLDPAMAANSMKISCSDFSQAEFTNAVFTLDPSGGAEKGLLKGAGREAYFSCWEHRTYWQCEELAARGSKWLANPGLTVEIDLPAASGGGAPTAKIYRSNYEGSDLLASGSCR